MKIPIENREKTLKALIIHGRINQMADYTKCQGRTKIMGAGLQRTIMKKRTPTKFKQGKGSYKAEKEGNMAL